LLEEAVASRTAVPLPQWEAEQLGEIANHSERDSRTAVEGALKLVGGYELPRAERSQHADGFTLEVVEWARSHPGMEDVEQELLQTLLLAKFEGEIFRPHWSAIASSKMATDFATTSARVIEDVRGGRVFEFFA
jgi:hypothetical protein